FVLLPGARTVLGAQSADPDGQNHDPEAHAWEGPPHTVVLDPFFIGKYEVTQAQWRRLHGTDPSHHTEGYPRADGRGHSLLLPVERVTWSAAHEAMRRLGLALPTTTQW